MPHQRWVVFPGVHLIDIRVDLSRRLSHQPSKVWKTSMLVGLRSHYLVAVWLRLQHQHGFPSLILIDLTIQAIDLHL